jgi:hypothetical protein
VQVLATAVTLLGAVVVAVGLLRIVATTMVYLVLFAEQPPGAALTLANRLNGPLLLVLVSGFLLVLAAIAAAVTTLVWVHRARTNAEALSPGMPFRHSPAASVGLLLVPVANLWFLRQVLQDICTGSSPWGRDERGAALVRAYWATTVATAAVALAGNLVLTVVGAALYGDGPLVDESVNTGLATAGIVFAVVVYALGAVCAVLFSLVVRHVSRLQTAALFAPAPRW